MPTDEGQLRGYLKCLREIDDNRFSRPQATAALPDRITKENGKPYGKDMYNGVINSLAKLGFLHKSADDNTMSVPTCFDAFIDDDSIPSTHLSGALLKAMKDADRTDQLDPYIPDQLSFMFDAIRKEPSDKVWDTKSMLWYIADRKKTPKGDREVDVDPIRGLQFLGVQEVGRNRTVLEYMRLLGYFRIIEEVEGGWRRCPETDTSHLHTQLSELRFEKWLEGVLKRLGHDHPVLIEKDVLSERLFRAIGRYISYRYSGGVGKQREFRKDIRKQLRLAMIQINDGHYKKRYADARPSVSKSNPEGNVLNDIRNFRRKMIGEALELWAIPDKTDPEKALRAMSISELESFLDQDLSRGEAIDILLARGAGSYSRLRLDRLSHGRGHFTPDPKLDPYPWQTDCVDQWANPDAGSGRESFCGIASAVTGTGKTVMALMAAARFVEANPKGIVSVVVPSTVLMYQWAEEAAKFIGLDSSTIGFCGNNFHDDFSDGKRLIVWIVNSAVKGDRMLHTIEEVDSGIPHLLIADECHRYGGEKHRSFLDVRAEARFAISATPPDETSMGEKHPILDSMGTVFYRLGYREAHEQKLISTFKVRYVGIYLTSQEQSKHTKISEAITKMLREIEEIYGPRIQGPNLIAEIQKIIKEGDAHPVCTRFLSATNERMKLIRNAERRNTASGAILRRIEEKREGYTMMLFHEEIKESELLVTDAPGEYRREDRKRAEERDPPDEEQLEIIDQQKEVIASLADWVLTSGAVRPGMYHSKFPARWKTWMVDWFRAGRLNVMLSVKSLAEGFDMPGADEGVIRTSTSNVRQRIQTIGRLIRKKQEEGSYATIWIIFVKHTKDESIFKKHDWESELPDTPDVQTYWELEGEGVEAVLMHKGGVSELPQPDRQLTSDELAAIDVTGLVPLDTYPDARAIHSTEGEVFVEEDGSMALQDMGAKFDLSFPPLDEAAALLSKAKGRAKIHVLENGHAVARLTGRIVYLASVNLDDFQNAAKDTFEKGDDFDTFMAGFKKT